MIERLKRLGYKNILLGLTGVIRDHYIFVFLFSAFLLNPSKRILFIAFVGLIVNHLILNIAQNWRQMTSVFLAFNSRVKPILNDETIKVERHLVSKFIDDDETFNLIENTELFKMATLGRGIDNMVFIYSVTTPQSTKNIVTNVVCFARPMAEGYIFVDVSPDKMKFFQKFRVLHEIGHALLSPFALHQKKQGGLLSVFAFILLAFTTLNFSAIPWWALLLYGVISLARVAYKFLDWFYSDFKDETFADLFGLCALSDSERNEMSKMKRLHLFVKNRKMLKWHQQTRLQILKYNLQLSTQESNKGKDAIDKMVEYTFNLITPRFLTPVKYLFWIIFYSFLAYVGDFNDEFLTNNILKYTFWITLIAFFIILFLNNYARRAFTNTLCQLEKQRLSIEAFDVHDV